MTTLQIMACALALAMPLPARAQAASPDKAARPPALPLHFESAFAVYKPYQDAKVANWRELNDSVRDAAARGIGHSAHDAPAPTSPAPSVAPPKPMPNHGDHPSHGGAP